MKDEMDFDKIFDELSAIEGFKEFQERIDRKLNKSISNYEYISWLERFSITYGDVLKDPWAWIPKEVSETDIKNLKGLRGFFEALSMYCYKHHYDDVVERFGPDIVHIKYNGKGYVVRLIGGEHVSVWSETPGKYSVDFCEIVESFNS